MKREVRVAAESWPLKKAFRIARGVKSEAHVIVVTIVEGDHRGCGECVPYARYGESPESVVSEIEQLRGPIEGGLSRHDLQAAMRPGAARNAIDCALIDLEAKAKGVRASALLGLDPGSPMPTAFTLSVDVPAAMGQAAGEAATAGYRLLKLKVAGGEDIARVEAVRKAAPAARLIVDANEGWTVDDYRVLAPALAGLGVALIEQPLKAGADDCLAGMDAPVPLCADESCHTRADLPRLIGRYGFINVKLDKAGGLTEAVMLAREARGQGLKLMVGCMVSTSLSMAPASLLGGMAEFVDLDGPLLLARDRKPALHYDKDLLYPPPRELWG